MQKAATAAAVAIIAMALGGIMWGVASAVVVGYEGDPPRFFELSGLPAGGDHEVATFDADGDLEPSGILSSSLLTSQHWGRSGTTLSPTTSNDKVAVLTNEGNQSAITGTNTSTTNDSIGVSGLATGATGATRGVYGAAVSADGFGVMGYNSAAGVDFRAVGGTWQTAERTAPGTPPSGQVYYYAKSDGKLYCKDDAGTEYDLTSGGGGGGTMDDWTIAGDSGSEVVSDGETATVAGSDGTDTTESGTRTVVVSLDLNELTAADDIDPDADELAYGDNSGSDNNTITPVDLLYTLPARRMPLCSDEFLNVTTTTATTFTFNCGSLQANGTSSGILGTAGTAAHPGLGGVRTGTTTTGRAAIAGGDTAIILGGGVWHFTCICLTAVASDGTDTYTLRLGFNDSITGDGTDSVMFRYTHSVNGGEWEAVTQAAGVETGSATDTNVALDTTNFVRFDIIINAGATSVGFYIDGTLVATNTTNIPSAATGLCPVSIIKSAGGSNRQCQVDFIGYYNELTTRR